MISLKASMTYRSKSYGCLAMRSAVFIKFLPVKVAQCRDFNNQGRIEERIQVAIFKLRCATYHDNVGIHAEVTRRHLHTHIIGVHLTGSPTQLLNETGDDIGHNEVM